MSLWKRLLGGLAAFVGALLWTPIILFLFWLPRLNYPDELAYGAAALFVLVLAVVGLRRPRLGGGLFAVASVSWLGLALLLWLELLEVA